MNEAAHVQLELRQRELLIDLSLDWSIGGNVVGHLDTFWPQSAFLDDQRFSIRVRFDALE